jgi:hypothetical protein
MKSFSQRKGLAPVADVIQVASINDELRNSIWNVLDASLWSTRNYVTADYGEAGIRPFSAALWFNFFKKPMDNRSVWGNENLKVIRDFFFSCEWNQVYDFVEFVVGYYSRSIPGLATAFNFVLERELSGYRIVSGQVVDITDKQEVEMLEEALRDTRFAGVNAHLKRALELLADRERPDYRNSIKESISAVESMARVIANNPKATLGDALKALEKGGKLHPALKDGFSKLYGYTSDKEGIRHAMMDEPNIYAADAKFFLLSCTSFVNYLKTQMQ